MLPWNGVVMLLIHFILSFYPIKFKVTCDHDNRWLIWFVLKDAEMKKMRSKYVFKYQGTW